MNPTAIPSDILLVTIRTQLTVLFTGQATAVTSVNNKGSFDILAQHENFISLIRDSLTLHFLDKTTKDFKITRGVLKVKGNSVDIYLGILQPTKTQPAPTPPPRQNPS